MRFVFPVITSIVALILVVPAATVVATPLSAIISATPGADDFQVAVVMSEIVPSEYVPLAKKDTVFEIPTIEELAGVTVIDCSVAAVTSNFAVPLIGTASKVAVIDSVPTADDVARPFLARSLLTDANKPGVDFQTESKVRSWVVLSENRPLALN